MSYWQLYCTISNGSSPMCDCDRPDEILGSSVGPLVAKLIAKQSESRSHDDQFIMGILVGKIPIPMPCFLSWFDLLMF